MRHEHSGIHPAIIALLRDLPGHQADQWTDAERERFLEAFTALVQYIYPANPCKHGIADPENCGLCDDERRNAGSGIASDG